MNGETHHLFGGLRWIEDCGRDFVFSLRTLRRTRVFAITVLLSLGVGIGGTAVVFAWLDRFALNPTPVIVDQNRLLRIVTAKPGGKDSPYALSFPDFLDWRRETHTTGSGLAYSNQAFGVRLRDAENAERVWGMFATSNYFDVLGVPLIRGHFGDASGDFAGSSPIAVISHRFWQSHFAGQDSVVGMTIMVNEYPVTIAGVAPEGFQGSEAVLAFDMWINVGAMPAFGLGADVLQSRERHWFTVIARRRPAETFAAAGADARAIGRRLAAAHVEDANSELTARPMSADQGPRELLTPLLAALLCMAGLLLCVVWANVMSLFLARTAARAQEIGIRRALGGSRTRIVRQLLVEAAVLGLGALIVAVAIAYYGHGVLLGLVPPLSISVDLGPWSSRSTAILISSLTGISVLVCALIPAVRISRESTVAALRTNERGMVNSRGRRALVFAQIVLSTVALLVAGLFVRSLSSLSHLESGVRDPENVVVASANLNFVTHSADVAPFIRRYLETATSSPGVTGAAVASELPLGFEPGEAVQAEPEGYARSKNDPSYTLVNRVSPGYLDALGIRLIDGRGFRDDDGPGSADVVIVNRAFADRYFGGANAVGRRVRIRTRTLTIVGVAETTKYVSLTERPRPFIYVPLLQWPTQQITLLMRGTGTINELAPSIRSVVRQVSNSLPLYDVRTLRTHMSASVFLQRTGASILGFLGGIAASLAGLGLYAVLAYDVLRRRRETGIRLALGASPVLLLASFLAEGARVWASGLAVGLLAAVPVGRLIQSQLAGITSTDVRTFAVVCALVALVSIAASLIPSWRATRADPITALRVQ